MKLSVSFLKDPRIVKIAVIIAIVVSLVFTGYTIRKFVTYQGKGKDKGLETYADIDSFKYDCKSGLSQCPKFTGAPGDACNILLEGACMESTYNVLKDKLVSANPYKNLAGFENKHKVVDNTKQYCYVKPFSHSTDGRDFNTNTPDCSLNTEFYNAPQMVENVYPGYVKVDNHPDVKKACIMEINPCFIAPDKIKEMADFLLNVENNDLLKKQIMDTEAQVNEMKDRDKLKLEREKAKNTAVLSNKVVLYNSFGTDDNAKYVTIDIGKEYIMANYPSMHIDGVYVPPDKDGTIIVELQFRDSLDTRQIRSMQNGIASEENIEDNKVTFQKDGVASTKTITALRVIASK